MQNQFATLETSHDAKATETTRRRYQRNAPFYDLMEGGMEKQHAAWRQQLWPLVKGPKVWTSPEIVDTVNVQRDVQNRPGCDSPKKSGGVCDCTKPR